jgi:asparagine synthase (glutamine-hydrolysing)
MAGIAGVLGKDRGTLDLMLERIKYRGPDETWKYQNGIIHLGCNELNIGGNGPAVSHYASEGTTAVSLDGRVYNPFKGDKTDAEMILDLYKRNGAAFAKKVDGDFVCVIADSDRLILARDWTGIKPLYYGHDKEGNLCFASEAKALLNISNNIKEFPPGYTYSRELGFRKYSSEAVETPAFETYDQAKKVVRDLLIEATEKRMKDGAVTGIFLSGGFDSSILAAIAHEINPDIECFTAGMEKGQDVPLAQDVTKYLGLKHHILTFDDNDIQEILPTAIHHQEMFEESCVHGAIANFLTARFARDRCKCVLTGEGADEFFAGYDGQYKEGENPEEVASICDTLLNVAHNTALQRLDRLNAANSLESRTPFLDAKVMDFALKIPLECKIHGDDQVGQWILRQAFEGILPEHLIYQTKRFFAQGSGVAYTMRQQAENVISQTELEEFNSGNDTPLLASVEELYYYKIFKKTLPHPTFDRLVGRWDPMRPAFFSQWNMPTY